MEALAVAEGLWRWTARAPTPDARHVGCVYYEAADATVLFDPLVPAGEEDRFLGHLEADVERRALPVVILLSAERQRRSADELAERFRARIGGALPRGVEAVPIEGASERQVAYFVRPQAALVVGGVFVGDGRGGLALVPAPGLEDRAALDRSLRAIAGLPVERVLVSHGEPVLADGRRAIELALS